MIFESLLWVELKVNIFKSEPPVPQNVTLIRNKVMTEIISEDEVLFSRVSPYSSDWYPYVRGNLDTDKYRDNIM